MYMQCQTQSLTSSIFSCHSTMLVLDTQVIVITHPWGFENAIPESRAFTNQIQTKCICYNCFVLQCLSVSKVHLACARHEEQFSNVGPVPCNSVSDLDDGKRRVSMLLSWNRFTMPTHVTFLALGLSTSIPLTIITTWLLALYAWKALCILVNCMLMASQKSC